MNKETWELVNRVAWVGVAALCWYGASRGYYSSTPRFNWWFWAVMFVLNLLSLGYTLGSIVKS